MYCKMIRFMKKKLKAMLLGAIMMSGTVCTQSCWMSFSDPSVRVIMGKAPEQAYIGCWSEVRETKDFKQIQSKVPIDVLFEQASDYKVVIEGNDTIARKLSTEVVHGCLTIDLEPGKYRNPLLRVKIYGPDVNSFETNSGSIIVKTDINLNDNLICRVTGSGNIEMMDVSAKSVDVSIFGSGDFDSGEISAKKLTVTIDGSGDVDLEKVDVTDKLVMSVSGSGNININGKAKNVEAKVFGSGDICGNLQSDSQSYATYGSGEINL